MAVTQQGADVEVQARLEVVTSHGMFAAEAGERASNGGQNSNIYYTASATVRPP